MLVRHQQKDLPVYNLLVNKGGPKLKESPADAKAGFVGSSKGQITVRIAVTHMTMQELIDRQLSLYTERRIIDKTGLAAPYDFTLEFAVENPRSGQEAGPNDGPALVTAVQEQLGLKLEPGTAPFDTVVIDHAERPAEN